jgi:hypothetical protein
MELMRGAGAGGFKIGKMAYDNAAEFVQTAYKNAVQELDTIQTVLNVAQAAFHGSPHKFDKFKMDKIGTGEGAQAYGHGLYFAESPGVAKSYKKKLSRLDEDAKEWIDSYGSQDEAVNAARQQKITSMDSYAGRPQEEIAKNEKIWDSTIDSIKNYSEGNLYEVDIPDSTIDNMLDWDKPLSEQSKEIQDIAAHVFARESGIDPTHANYDAMVDVIRPQLSSKTGKDMHRAMVDHAVYNGSAKSLEEAQSMVSKKLDIVDGIPGIKYLDGTSRSKGEGTRNFVVFDENSVKVLKRNNEKVK